MPKRHRVESAAVSGTGFAKALALLIPSYLEEYLCFARSLKICRLRIRKRQVVPVVVVVAVGQAAVAQAAVGHAVVAQAAVGHAAVAQAAVAQAAVARAAVGGARAEISEFAGGEYCLPARWPSKVGIATRRLRAGWDNDFLLQVVAGKAPT